AVGLDGVRPLIHPMIESEFASTGAALMSRFHQLSAGKIWRAVRSSSSTALETGAFAWGSMGADFLLEHPASATTSASAETARATYLDVERIGTPGAPARTGPVQRLWTARVARLGPSSIGVRIARSVLRPCMVQRGYSASE